MDPNLYYSITPPLELVQRLKHLWVDDAIVRAYQAGADAELEACCEWLEKNTRNHMAIEFLRAARRPSLKEQALKALKNIDDACESEGFSRGDDTDIIRRALEVLPD